MNTNLKFAQGALSRAILAISLCLALAPWLMPATAHGQVFVLTSDTNGNGVISEYTTAGALVTGTLAASGAYPWSSIAVSGSNIYVSQDESTEFTSDTVVLEYSTSGALENSSLVSGLGQLMGMAVSDDGTKLYVADIVNSNVGEYDASTGTALNASLISGLGDPGSIAVSGSNLYVLSGIFGDSGVIGQYTVDAANAVVTASNPSLVSSLAVPGGLAISGTDLYVTNGGSSGTVSVYSPTGATVNAYLQGYGEYPGAIASSGTNIYVLGGTFQNLILATTVSGGTVIKNFGDITGIANVDGIAAESGTPAAIISGSLPAITDISMNGPFPAGSAIVFSASTGAGLAVRVQWTTTPGMEGSWVNLPGGGAAPEDPLNPGNYELTTTSYPLAAGIYFRFVASSTGYTDGKSDPLALGPNDLHITVGISITGPTSNGAIIAFAATTVTGLQVRIQSSLDGTTWIDLPDNNGALMTETDPVDNPGNYSLNSTFYPAGSAVSFRAVATDSASLETDSAPLGTYALTRAVLSIGVTLTTTSDPIAGLVAHIGDELTYTFNWQNIGTATATNMVVVTPVPVYLHSDSTVVCSTTVGSSTVTTIHGSNTGQLAVGGAFGGGVVLSGGAHPFPSTSTTISAIVDNTHFTISQPAAATSTIGAIFTYGSQMQQFAQSDLTFNQYGTYLPPTTSTSNDAKVMWNVSNLDPASSQSLTLGVQLSGKVRINQQIGLGNNYSVYSSAFQPPYSATGFTSGSPAIGTNVEGAISFKMVPKSPGVVAPGGLMTYTCTLSNLGTTAVANAVAVVVVPDGMRYAATYPTTPKATNGVAWASSGRVPYPAPVLNYFFGDPHPQLVINVGGLAAAGNSLHRDSVALNVTFQAQWIDPTTMPTITTINYGAAFLNPAPFLDTLTGRYTTQYALFLAAYKAAGYSLAAAPGYVDFIAFLANTAHETALSSNDSGVVGVSLFGSLSAEPQLWMLKAVSSPVTDTIQDGLGQSVDTVQPGDEISFILGAGNKGDSEADDVYIQDGLPANCTFVSAKLLGASPSVAKSKLVPVLDQLGIDGFHHHIQFTGLHLDPNDGVIVQYTVKVASGLTAPANGTFIDNNACSVGSSSLTETPVGLYANGPIEVVGQALFAQPVIRTLVPSPNVCGTDIVATSDAMTAIYNANWSASPTPDASGSTAAFFFADNTPYDGQRYYIHYANTGNVAATNVSLDVPLPAHTAFYRASFVSLPPNKATGALGYLPGTLIRTPAESTIVAPLLLSTGGTATFTFSRLAASAEGDVMVEVIVTPDAIQAAGSLVGDPTAPPVTMHDGSITSMVLSGPGRQLTPPLLVRSSSAPYSVQQALNSAFLDNLTPAVPQVGIFKSVPQQVAPGSNFDVEIVIFNHGDVGAHPIVNFTIPPNTTFVSAAFGNSYIGVPAVGAGPGALISGVLASNNGAVTQGDLTPLLPHTGAALTVTLQATGPVGTDIVDSSADVIVDDMGTVSAPATATQVTDSPAIGLIGVITGRPLYQATVDSSEVFLIDIGGGNIVAQGAGNIVASGAGNIVASGAGNIVASGAGNIVASGAGNLLGLGNTNASALISSQASIVASGAGNVIAGEGCNIVASGAGNLVASGAGNLVASGAGNLAVTGGGNLVASGAGNLVASGAGNLVASGAGNYVAAGGGIVASGAGNFTGPTPGLEAAILTAPSSTGAGNLLVSTPGTSASILTPGGNIISAGSGNFTPSQ